MTVASHNELVIVGGGGHGRELFDAARGEWRIRGFVDDDPGVEDRLARIGSLRLGGIEWLEANPSRYALGIGTSSGRRRLATRLDQAGCQVATVVHPGVSRGSDVRLANGVVVFDRCTLTTNVEIGAHTHLNVGCAVQHDSTVGSFVQMSPGVLVNGDCVIGNDVFLGTGAIVTRGCTIGDGARVGAGSVVLDDVPTGAFAFGTPAQRQSARK
jgi:hypothetical protein